jgi:GH43 family beta-xylosidase
MTQVEKPIRMPNAADPWIIFHGGFYYYSESRCGRGLYVRRSRAIEGIVADSGIRVWNPPAGKLNSRNLWAPQLHLIDGRWYVYYTADDGRNENRRVWVLESEDPDPRGSYVCRGPLETGGWATDGTVLTGNDGRRYFIWSGLAEETGGRQNLYIALMKGPLAIWGTRALLTTPDQGWERASMPVCERPQVLRRNEDIFVAYFANGSRNPHCCLGLLRHQSGSLLDPRKWVKYGPVSTKTDEVWGMGYCSLAKFLDRNEDWIIYQCGDSAALEAPEAAVYARPFSWSSEGFPEIGGHGPGATVGTAIKRSHALSYEV